MAKQNILLIINPVAGRKKAKKIWYKIICALSQKKYKTMVFITFKRGEATEIVKKYAHESQKIICCGGDGTLHEVFAGLLSLKIQVPVAHIPTGTTNDISFSLNLPRSMKKIIDIAVNGQAMDYDIGQFNDDLCFSYVASFGAFTKVSYSTPQWMKNLMGRMAYFFHGIMYLADIRSYKMKVLADGREIEGNFIFGSVSNSSIIGGLVRLPKSDISLNDGEFEVILIRKPETSRELRSIVRGILGQRFDEPYVYFFKAKELDFHFEKEVAWTTDGEFGGTHTKVLITNLKHMAKVIVP